MIVEAGKSHVLQSASSRRAGGIISSQKASRFKPKKSPCFPLSLKAGIKLSQLERQSCRRNSFSHEKVSLFYQTLNGLNGVYPHRGK